MSAANRPKQRRHQRRRWLPLAKGKQAPQPCNWANLRTEPRPPLSRNPVVALRPLGVWDALIGEVGDIAIEGLAVDQAHGLLVAGLAEEPLAAAEHDREDLQPQLVDKVVLHQRAQELEAAGDDDVPLQFLLELRDLVYHVAVQHGCGTPVGILEGRGDDVLGLAVQPIRQLATPGWPLRGEPLVRPAAEQQGLCPQRLIERELAHLW